MNALNDSHPTKQDPIRRWVETWDRADKALNEIKRKELREFDLLENQQWIDDMLDYALAHAEPRTTSGLIEQQRWFMKVRKQMEQKARLESTEEEH